VNVTNLIKKLKSLILPRKSSLPSLLKVLIESKNDTINFTTTDLDVTTSISMRIDSPEFIAVVDLKTLISILSSLPKNSSVRMSLENTNLIIHSTLGNFPIHSDNRDSYHSIPSQPENTEMCHISVVSQMEELLPFAADKFNEIRAQITGIRYDHEKHNLIGTNGHYLAIYKDIPEIFNASVTIPTDAIKYLAKLLKSSSEYGKGSTINCIETGISTNHATPYVSFIGEDFSVITRSIEGQFPPYEKVLPTNFEFEMSLNKEIILNIPKECMNKSTHQIVFSTIDATKELTVRTENYDVNWSTICGTSNFQCDMCFNAVLLQNIANFIGNDPLILKIVDARTAVMYEDSRRLALIMPIKIHD
jgi:DNA polymerase-3 subunit beta